MKILVIHFKHGTNFVKVHFGILTIDKSKIIYAIFTSNHITDNKLMLLTFNLDNHNAKRSIYYLHKSCRLR